MNLSYVRIVGWFGKDKARPPTLYPIVSVYILPDGPHGQFVVSCKGGLVHSAYPVAISQSVVPEGQRTDIEAMGLLSRPGLPDKPIHALLHITELPGVPASWQCGLEVFDSHTGELLLSQPNDLSLYKGRVFLM